jgi:adenine-specific DNA-methyltransferase
VAYRDKRTKRASPPRDEDRDRFYPLICAADVQTSGVLLHGRHHEMRGMPLFIRNRKTNLAQSVEKPIIAVQRITSPDQNRRLVCAVVPRTLIQKWNGVIGENHVIFIRVTRQKPALTSKQLVHLLSSEAVDRVFRAMSGVVNVSVHELSNLPLPDPDILSTLLAKRQGKAIEDSDVREAYMLTAARKAIAVGLGKPNMAAHDPVDQKTLRAGE